MRATANRMQFYEPTTSVFPATARVEGPTHGSARERGMTLRQTERVSVRDRTILRSHSENSAEKAELPANVSLIDIAEIFLPSGLYRNYN